MLRKFCCSKTGRVIGGLILTFSIYYSMTDGFTQTIGEAARVGADAAVSESAPKGPAAEWVVISLLTAWILFVLGKDLWRKYRRKPKNDVNVRC